MEKLVGAATEVTSTFGLRKRRSRRAVVPWPTCTASSVSTASGRPSDARARSKTGEDLGATIQRLCRGFPRPAYAAIGAKPLLSTYPIIRS